MSLDELIRKYPASDQPINIVEEDEENCDIFLPVVEFDESLIKADESDLATKQNEKEPVTKLTIKEIKKWAKETPLEVLEEFISQSGDEHLRKIAHDEMARREKEEHVQDDKDKKKNLKKSDDITVLDESNEIVLGEECCEEVKKGCLMFFPIIDEEKWTSTIQNLLPEAIVTKLEFEPHITILYGFLDDELDKAELAQVVLEFLSRNPLALNVKPISLFQNDEHDVVKLEIEDTNGNLTRLNQVLRCCFAYSNSYNDYTPHMTLGYVKPHEGERYQNTIINPTDYGIQALSVGRIIYSDYNKEKLVITNE